MRADLDFETYSPVDLKTAGLGRYAEHPDTDILVACYSIDGGDVQTWTPDDPPPRDLFECSVFTAHNALFERAIWWRIGYRKHGWPNCPEINAWRCSMALGQSYGLPGGLDEMAAALLLIGKDPRGKALIRYWCVPQGKAKQRRMPFEDFAQFDALCEYCAADVRAERAIVAALPRPELPPAEQAAWEHQAIINERGMLVDIDTAAVVAKAVKKLKGQLAEEAKALTGGIAPTQRAKTLQWLQEAGVDVLDLKKTTVQRQLDNLPESDMRRVLELRLSAAKVSVEKYPVLLRRTSFDHRLRHSQVYHGASTGRVTHRGFQPGNLPRGEVSEPWWWADRPELIADPEGVGLFHDPMLTYSAMVRSMIVAKPGHKLVSGDYSQIEARMVAYLAGQHDLIDVFLRKLDPYKYMASRIFGIPVDRIAKDSRERFVGKAATLGAGFGMGPTRFAEYCKDNGAEIELREAERAISEYRNSVPAIVKFWYVVKAAAVNAVRDPGQVYPVGRVSYACSKNKKWLFCFLPSGRRIAYLRPRIVTDEFGEQLRSAGVNTYTHEWTEDINLWHGTLVENIVQASCRDIMVEAAGRLEEEWMDVILTVHDEILCEVKSDVPAGAIHGAMMEPVKWASGFPLALEGWEGQRYRK